jgi:hypothetical protein
MHARRQAFRNHTPESGHDRLLFGRDEVDPAQQIQPCQDQGESSLEPGGEGSLPPSAVVMVVIVTMMMITMTVMVIVMMLVMVVIVMIHRRPPQSIIRHPPSEITSSFLASAI